MSEDLRASLIGKRLDNVSFGRLLRKTVQQHDDSIDVEQLIAMVHDRSCTVHHNVLHTILRNRRYEIFRCLNTAGLIDENSCIMWFCRHLINAPVDILDTTLTYIRDDIIMMHQKYHKNISRLRTRFYFQQFFYAITPSSYWMVDKIKPLFKDLKLDYIDVQTDNHINDNQVAVLMNTATDRIVVFELIFAPATYKCDNELDSRTYRFNQTHYNTAKLIMLSYRQYIPDVMNILHKHIHNKILAPALFVNDVIVDIIVLFADFVTNTMIVRFIPLLPLCIDLQWCTWLCTHRLELVKQQRKYIHGGIRDYHAVATIGPINEYTKRIDGLKSLYASFGVDLSG